MQPDKMWKTVVLIICVCVVSVCVRVCGQAIAPLLENNHPPPDLCEFFCKVRGTRSTHSLHCVPHSHHTLHAHTTTVHTHTRLRLHTQSTPSQPPQHAPYTRHTFPVPTWHTLHRPSMSVLCCTVCVSAALSRETSLHGGDRGVHACGAENPQTQHGRWGPAKLLMCRVTPESDSLNSCCPPPFPPPTHTHTHRTLGSAPDCGSSPKSTSWL